MHLHPCKHKHLLKTTYTHLKIVFGKNPKTILPSPKASRRVKSSPPAGRAGALFVRGKSSAFSSPGITATKIWFFEKPKTKPVLVYPHHILWYIFMVGSTKHDNKSINYQSQGEMESNLIMTTRSFILL